MGYSGSVQDYDHQTIRLRNWAQDLAASQLNAGPIVADPWEVQRNQQIITNQVGPATTHDGLGEIRPHHSRVPTRAVIGEVLLDTARIGNNPRLGGCRAPF